MQHNSTNNSILYWLEIPPCHAYIKHSCQNRRTSKNSCHFPVVGSYYYLFIYHYKVILFVNNQYVLIVVGSLYSHASLG